MHATSPLPLLLSFQLTPLVLSWLLHDVVSRPSCILATLLGIRVGHPTWWCPSPGAGELSVSPLPPPARARSSLFSPLLSRGSQVKRAPPASASLLSCIVMTQHPWGLAHLVCPSVTFFFLLSLSVFFFFWPSCTACAFRIFSSLTKYGTRVRSNERAKSQPLDRQGTPSLTFIIRVLRVRTFHGEIRCHDAFDRTGLYEFKGIISCSSLG